MTSKIDKMKEKLDELIGKGEQMHLTLMNKSYNNFEELFEKVYESSKVKWVTDLKPELGYEEFKSNLPSLHNGYESWYSFAQEIVKQLLPNRLNDFNDKYKIEKSPKSLDIQTYRISDYLQNISIRDNSQRRIDKYHNSATLIISHLKTQVKILSACREVFDSEIANLQSIVQADIFGSEIEVAKELLKNKHLRAAGAVAGVVLERHLKTIFERNNLKTGKKSPGISFYTDKLKEINIIDTPKMRQLKYCGDIRNKCTHAKDEEPTHDEVSELISHTNKFMNTLF